MRISDGRSKADERHCNLTWYQVVGGAYNQESHTTLRILCTRWKALELHMISSHRRGVCARFASVPQSAIVPLLNTPHSSSPSKAMFIVEPWRKKTLLSSDGKMNEQRRGPALSTELPCFILLSANLIYMCKNSYSDHVPSILDRIQWWSNS